MAATEVTRSDLEQAERIVRTADGDRELCDAIAQALASAREAGSKSGCIPCRREAGQRKKQDGAMRPVCF